jgi:hypothetical protein
MSSTGNVFPTVGANVDRAASAAWTTPGNVVSDNGSNASVAVPSDYLVTSAYGFTLPAHAVIVGVTVRVEASETGGGNSNYIPQLHSATTPTLIGSAKSAVTVTGTTPTVSSNGGTSDLWGATLTPAIVNAAGFGVSIWSTDTGNTLSIDYVTIAIEYTPFPTASVVSKDIQTYAASVALTASTKVTSADTVMSPLGLFLPVRTYAKDLVSGSFSATLAELAITSYSATVSNKVATSVDIGPLGLPIRTYTFPAKETGTPTSISATSQALSVDAGQLTLTYTFSVDAVDALALTEYAATFRAHYSVAATAVSLDIAALGGGATLVPVFGAGTYALNIQSYAATGTFGFALSATADSFALTENAATVVLAGVYAATRDALVLTEYAASGLTTNVTFTGTIPDISVRKNSGIYTFDFSAYFANTTTYAIAPSLPSGMSFNTSTGILTINTNTAAAGKTDGYIVTGS